MNGKSLVGVKELSRKDIEAYIDSANRMAEGSLPDKDLSKAIAALLFFEESTRTRVGFTTAAYRLGAKVVTISETKFHERMGTAESLEDTIRSIQAYCDVICLRHPDKDIFKRLEPILEKPIINCGNDDDEHPTQSLLDLFTIKRELNRLDNLSVAIVGNPRYSRSAHSLTLALSKFNDIKIRTISPKELYMPAEYKDPYLKFGNVLEETTEMAVDDVDIVYVTGFPAKLPIATFSQETQSHYWITPEVTAKLKSGAIVLCPLPRIDEIDTKVDSESVAKYFRQSENALYMRMAVLDRAFS